MASYYIDAIAREKGRDVLMLSFIELTDELGCPNWLHPDELEKLPNRNKVISWLDENHIPWKSCGEFWNGKSYLSYPGHIYIDVIPTTSDPNYIHLCEFLINLDGSMRLEGVKMWLIAFSLAIKNKHHDNPEYEWD